MKEVTEKQKLFVHKFIELGNQTQAYQKVYKSCKNASVAAVNANRLLKNANVLVYYREICKKVEGERIATAQEVLEYFTGVMRGTVRDQFDLDASLSDRTEAAKQLAKRYGIDKQKIDTEDIDLVVNIVSDSDE